MSLSFGFHFKWLRPLPLIGAFLLAQNVTETGTAFLCLQATRYGSSWQQTLTSQQKKYCVLWVTIHRGHRQKLYFIYTLIVAMIRAPWSVQFSLWTAFFFKKRGFFLAVIKQGRKWARLLCSLSVCFVHGRFRVRYFHLILNHLYFKWEKTGHTRLCLPRLGN